MNIWQKPYNIAVWTGQGGQDKIPSPPVAGFCDGGLLLYIDIAIVKKTILIYGLSLAALVGLLRVIEYRFLMHDFSFEFYIGTIALFFTTLGVWAGFRLTRKRTVLENSNFVQNAAEQARLGISPRELEVLDLISRGMSNQEIADRLFVSLHTVKSHTSSLFLKLDVNRRTQAIRKARELQLIP